jgi:anti-sigma regulatory factor (Ser/Thr protein kinase)
VPISSIGHATAAAISTKSWPFQTHLELAALPTAPACARGHVRSVALEWGMRGLSDSAELLVSELITNAVHASDGLKDQAIVPVIHLWLTADQASMVIQVWDRNDEMPVRLASGPGEESGRGLMIIDALSYDWGCYREADGKVVWASLSGNT